jgi:hypothetical protein
MFAESQKQAMQSAFDLAAKQFSAQGKFSTDAGGKCKYISEYGSRCALGACLRPSTDPAAFEGKAADACTPAEYGRVEARLRNWLVGSQ